MLKVMNLFFAMCGMLLAMFSGILTMYAVASGRFEYATASACIALVSCLFVTVNMNNAEGS